MSPNNRITSIILLPLLKTSSGFWLQPLGLFALLTCNSEGLVLDTVNLPQSSVKIRAHAISTHCCHSCWNCSWCCWHWTELGKAKMIYLRLAISSLDPTNSFVFTITAPFMSSRTLNYAIYQSVNIVAKCLKLNLYRTWGLLWILLLAFGYVRFAISSCCGLMC